MTQYLQPHRELCRGLYNDGASCLEIARLLLKRGVKPPTYFYINESTRHFAEQALVGAIRKLLRISTKNPYKNRALRFWVDEYQ